MSDMTFGDRIVATELSTCRSDFVRSRSEGWCKSLEALSPLVAGMAIGKTHMAQVHFDADPIAARGAINEILWMLHRSRQLMVEGA